MAKEKVEQNVYSLYIVSGTTPGLHNEVAGFKFAHASDDLRIRDNTTRLLHGSIEVKSRDLTVSLPDEVNVKWYNFQSEKEARAFAYQVGTVLYDGKALKEEQEKFSGLKATLLKTFDETQKNPSKSIGFFSTIGHCKQNGDMAQFKDSLSACSNEDDIRALIDSAKDHHFISRTMSSKIEAVEDKLNELTHPGMAYN